MWFNRNLQRPCVPTFDCLSESHLNQVLEHVCPGGSGAWRRRTCTRLILVRCQASYNGSASIHLDQAHATLGRLALGMRLTAAVCDCHALAISCAIAFCWPVACSFGHYASSSVMSRECWPAPCTADGTADVCRIATLLGRRKTTQGWLHQPRSKQTVTSTCMRTHRCCACWARWAASAWWIWAYLPHDSLSNTHPMHQTKSHTHTILMNAHRCWAYWARWISWLVELGTSHTVVGRAGLSSESP